MLVFLISYQQPNVKLLHKTFSPLSLSLKSHWETDDSETKPQHRNKKQSTQTLYIRFSHSLLGLWPWVKHLLPRAPRTAVPRTPMHFPSHLKLPQGSGAAELSPYRAPTRCWQHQNHSRPAPLAQDLHEGHSQNWAPLRVVCGPKGLWVNHLTAVLICRKRTIWVGHCSVTPMRTW